MVSLIVRPALAVAVLLGATAGLAGPASSAPVRTERAARPTQSVSDGVRTLSVSQDVLDPNGQTITVEGTGYDEFKGIYVAFCVEPLPGQLPTPCGGGADTEGNTGASFWISSNPPAYGEGLAVPYGPGGTFRQTIDVTPVIANVDCRRVQCVVATRNDHIRTSDRGQDLFVPITFAQPADPGTPDPGNPDQPPVDTTIPQTTTTTAPQPPPDEDRPAPAATVAEDGRSVTAGGLRLAATKARDLDPDGEGVVVTGSGFDETRGLRVAYCAVGAGPVPGPCLGNAKAQEVVADARGWLDVSSNPSAAQAATSTPYGPAGSFGTTIAVVARIDEDTDCRQVECAIVTLAHPDRPRDRGQELVLPVTFPAEEVEATTTTTGAAASTTTTAAPAADDAEDEDSGGGGSTGLVLGLLALVLAAGAGAVVWLRRRNATTTGATTTTDATDEASP